MDIPPRHGQPQLMEPSGRMRPGAGSGSGRVTLLGVASSSLEATITMSLPFRPDVSTERDSIPENRTISMNDKFNQNEAQKVFNSNSWDLSYIKKKLM